PFHRGAQQPGMTGQVKEDILVRLGELGVAIEDGKLLFKPSMLKRSEYLKEKGSFKYSDLRDGMKEMDLEPGMLSFTCCQVPVVYQSSDRDVLEVEYRDGQTDQIEGHMLDKKTSELIFGRTGDVKLIRVELKDHHLS
ncbi:MAG: hypothetical protein R3283_09580, partial [Balneolaceae bacterium]|nr:hypothetical protein [Balneolaceae bacterium]